MSLKKRLKNNLISLRKYKKFILKNKIASLDFNVNIKVFLILSCIRLKLEKKDLNGLNVTSLYFESPQNLTESNLNSFISKTFFDQKNSEKIELRLFTEIVENLFIFYLNSSVFKNINEMKKMEKHATTQEDHQRFLLVNESIGNIMNFLKIFFPLDFNDIFRKIILLAYK